MNKYPTSFEKIEACQFQSAGTRKMVDAIIQAIDAMIERHLKGDFIGPEEYSSLQNQIIGYYAAHGRDTYLNKYLNEDHFFLYGTCYQRYDNAADIMAEIEDQLDCKT